MNLFYDHIIKKITTPDGSICVTEFNKLPFEPKRMFFVKNVPLNTERGGHAHYKTEQLLICISGYIKCITHDGITRHENMMEPNDCIYVKNMIWDTQRFLSENAVLLVLANTEYDKDDYINDFRKFKELISGKENLRNI